MPLLSPFFYSDDGIIMTCFACFDYMHKSLNSQRLKECYDQQHYKLCQAVKDIECRYIFEPLYFLSRKSHNTELPMLLRDTYSPKVIEYGKLAFLKAKSVQKHLHNYWITTGWVVGSQ